MNHNRQVENDNVVAEDANVGLVVFSLKIQGDYDSFMH